MAVRDHHIPEARVPLLQVIEHFAYSGSLALDRPGAPGQLLEVSRQFHLDRHRALLSLVIAGERRAAEPLVIDQLRYRRVVATEGALRVLTQLDHAELHGQRIEEKQAAHKR